MGIEVLIFAIMFFFLGILKENFKCFVAAFLWIGVYCVFQLKDMLF